LGYFVLDNATNNNTAIAALSKANNFNHTHRRLRCSPHTLNLVGQAIISSTNQDAYDNIAKQYTTEEAYLIGIINHMKICNSMSFSAVSSKLSAVRLVMACVDVCPSFHFRFRLSTLSALFFVLTRI
jgi:hypothetical protein